jgi:putrescine transport system permease protein
VRRGITPEINALATIMVSVVALFVIFAGILMARQERARQRDIQMAKAGDGSVTGAVSLRTT